MLLLLSFILIAKATFTNPVFANLTVIPTAEEIYINDNPDTLPIAFQRLVFNITET